MPRTPEVTFVVTVSEDSEETPATHDSSDPALVGEVRSDPETDEDLSAAEDDVVVDVEGEAGGGPLSFNTRFQYGRPIVVKPRYQQ